MFLSGNFPLGGRRAVCVNLNNVDHKFTYWSFLLTAVLVISTLSFTFEHRNKRVLLFSLTPFKSNQLENASSKIHFPFSAKMQYTRYDICITTDNDEELCDNSFVYKMKNMLKHLKRKICFVVLKYWNYN